MPFNLKLDNVDFIREPLNAISELIDEAELLVTDEGLKILAADRAVVVVVDFLLSKDIFKEYNKTEDMAIGVNLANLLRVLKRATFDDRVEINIDDKIEIKFIGKSFRAFTLPIITVSKESLPPLDKLSWSTSFEIGSEDLSSAIEDATLISDSAVIFAEDEKVGLHAENEISEVKTDLTEIIKSLQSSENARSRYSLDYIRKMIKAKKLSEMLSVHLSNDYPIKLQYNASGIKLSFILAPRVE